MNGRRGAVTLIEFVEQRADEDDVLARVCDPPDRRLLYRSRLARRLLRACRWDELSLTPRQYQLMVDLARQHRSHRDYDETWEHLTPEDPEAPD